MSVLDVLSEQKLRFRPFQLKAREYKRDKLHISTRSQLTSRAQTRAQKKVMRIMKKMILSGMKTINALLCETGNIHSLEGVVNRLRSSRQQM